MRVLFCHRCEHTMNVMWDNYLAFNCGFQQHRIRDVWNQALYPTSTFWCSCEEKISLLPPACSPAVASRDEQELSQFQLRGGGSDITYIFIWFPELIYCECSVKYEVPFNVEDQTILTLCLFFFFSPSWMAHGSPFLCTSAAQLRFITAPSSWNASPSGQSDRK